MISDEELDSLPDDSEAAFVQYESVLREAVRVADSTDDFPAWDVKREYVAHVLAFVDARGIPLELSRNPPADRHEFMDWYDNFIRAVDYYKAIARLQVSARKKQNVTVLTLSPDLKTQMGGHLTALRKIVCEAEIPESKRDALFRRINNLQDEVDRDRTRTEAAMALWLDLTSAISKGAKNLDPAIERMERIVRIFAKAKDENEQKVLTAPQERKRIAPPTTPTEGALPQPPNDEIPF